MIVKRTIQLKNMSEAREVLNGIFKSNSSLLKKNPSYFEDYSFLVNGNSVTLNYSIEDKSNIKYGLTKEN